MKIPYMLIIAGMMMAIFSIQLEFIKPDTMFSNTQRVLSALSLLWLRFEYLQFKNKK